MKKEKYYENYPAWIVFLSNLVSIAIYVSGALIIYRLGLIWLILYILYILVLEFRLINGHCTNCYYYGKTCAFGKGKISRLFFRKGNPKNFCKKQMAWKDIIPDFLVSLIPAVVGIVLLIIKFNWYLLIMIIILFLLTFTGNAFVRGKLVCKYCKQRGLGCPAQKLFEKR
ncbi:MAG: hypothetical protein PHF67_03670 [Candidatus Nanoarchaeia archaeon]|nr:hypothetical protein [Candidatus Nanoarchaeia archaeon]